MRTHVLEVSRPLVARDPTAARVVHSGRDASAPVPPARGPASTRAQSGGPLGQEEERRSGPVTRMSDMGCGAKPMNLRDSRAVLGRQSGRD